MDYLIKASVIILLFWACYKLLLERDTFFDNNRLFLLAGLIGAIIFPLIVIPVNIEIPLINNTNLPSTLEITAAEEKSFDWLQLFTALYFIGVIAFAIRLIVQLFSLTTLIQSNNKLKLGKYIHVNVKDDISPFSFFNWIVYNPLKFTKDELSQVITHEKIHVKEYHSIDTLLSQLATVILWFNPIIWLYKKDLQQNLEFIADHKTQNKTNCNKSYQKLLLKTSISNNQMAFTSNFYNSLIKKRIIMLQKSESRKLNQLKFIAILPLLAAFFMSFSVEEVYITKTNLVNNTYTNSDIEIKSNIVNPKEDNNLKSINKKSSIKKSNTIKKENDLKLKSQQKKSRKQLNSINNFKTKSVITNNVPRISLKNEDIKVNAKKQLLKPSTKIQDNKKPLIVVDGKIIGNLPLEININPDLIKEIFVLKGKKAKDKYGEKGKNGVIEIITKIPNKPLKDKLATTKEKNTFETKFELSDSEHLNPNNVQKILENPNNLLVIIDNKKVSRAALKKLDKNKIESISVLKGKAAAEKLGKEAEKGVIYVITKKE